MAGLDNFDDINLNKTEDELGIKSGTTNISKPVSIVSSTPAVEVKMPYDNKSTLDEPLLQTLGREFSGIGRKIKITFARGDKTERLQELLKYDLWGPFIFFLVFSVVLSSKRRSQFQSIFVSTFTFACLGSLGIGLNSRLMGCKM